MVEKSLPVANGPAATPPGTYWRLACSMPNWTGEKIPFPVSGLNGFAVRAGNLKSAIFRQNPEMFGGNPPKSPLEENFFANCRIREGIPVIASAGQIRPAAMRTGDQDALHVADLHQ
ncbi:MAG TPA: hypothetical protein VHC00_05820 [Rhizobiaceae bacterium]|nr:hypothetical protein [Rhizobiaceae bacterium]